jgi:hypothetical protein
MRPTPATIVAADALGEATFGDRRRADRTQALVTALAAMPGASVSEACGTWGQSQGAYRLLRNNHVAVPELISSIGAATGERIRAARDVTTVLLLQDTTEITPTSARGAQDLGPLANPESQGLLLHSTVAVTASGLPLGIIEQEVWVRDDEDPPSRPARYRTPIEGKESAKWLRGTQTALSRLAAHQRGIVVADREAGIFALFHLCRTHDADLLVRAAQNRRIAEPAGKLASAAARAPVRGAVEVAVGRAREREPRTASVTIRSTTVMLLPPDLASYAAARRAWWAEHPDTARLVSADLTPVELQVVEVTEDAPPEGVTPLHWRLLTTLPGHRQLCTALADRALPLRPQVGHPAGSASVRVGRGLAAADGALEPGRLAGVVADRTGTGPAGRLGRHGRPTGRLAGSRRHGDRLSPGHTTRSGHAGRADRTARRASGTAWRWTAGRQDALAGTAPGA